MSGTPTAGRSTGAAVTIVGLITLLMGGAYASFGGSLIWAGATWAERAGKDPWGPVVSLAGLGPALLVAVGVAFVPLGLLGLLAGAGALRRKQWGRILTFILAGVAFLLGLVWVGGGDQDTTDIVLGAAQVLYGVTAIVLLIRNSAKFSARHAGQVTVRGPAGGRAEPSAAADCGGM